VEALGGGDKTYNCRRSLSIIFCLIAAAAAVTIATTKTSVLALLVVVLELLVAVTCF